MGWPSVVRWVQDLAHRQPDRPAQYVKANSLAGASASNPFTPVSYKEFWSRIEAFGAGLKDLGVTKGSHVALISDNRPEWLIADLAVLGLGAVDVPRGNDATQEEIAYIVAHADCSWAIVENQAQLERLLAIFTPALPLRALIVLDNSLGTHRKAPSSLQLLNASEVLILGQKALHLDPQTFARSLDSVREDDLATLIYTSGTTGEPKGVMLTHRSFIFQMERALKILELQPEDVFLSVLPIWHSYERAIEYIVLGGGASIGYSRPVGKIMLEDMAALKPTWFISVPRIWESIRSAIYRNIKSKGRLVRVVFDFFIGIGSRYADLRDKFFNRWPRYVPHWPLGTRVTTALPLLFLLPLRQLGDLLIFKKLRQLLGGFFIAGISGGGALPRHVDDFFRAVGVLVLEGYGLTETAPVLSVRLRFHPVPLTVGPMLPDVEFEIRDEATLSVLSPGQKGVLWVKSPQVMLGYYKRPDLTQAVVIDGWLNTGDLAVSTLNKEIRIVGRVKDTIVLLGGENVEPEPIEQRLLQSEFIDQVMVVGQDQKYLGALIVPNSELLEAFAQDRNLSYMDREDLLENPVVLEYVREIIQHLVNPRSGFKPFECVYQFKLLARPFEPVVEVTASLKLRRLVIAERRAQTIQSLFRNAQTA
ncbi:MAG: AMP-binding protein [Spirochaetales bacterium]|nr:AMP-binding protein [Spirochaetales bacterium]